MIVTFGSALDGAAHPTLLGPRDACHGELRVGPLGFLTLLETQLGLGGAELGEPVRVGQYRARLEQADDGERFFSRSFRADPFGVARTLYHWRESLLHGGWDGCATPTAPPRLRDLARVEANPGALLLAPGLAERLGLAIAALATRRPQLDEVRLVEPRNTLPRSWRRVFDALTEWNVAIRSLPDSRGEGTGNLGHLQRVLAGTTTPSPPVRDSSLLLLTARSDLEAAEAIASWLVRLDGDAVIADATADPVLNDAMKAIGRPSMGVCESSRLRPALQVLPLALALQWDPVDPNRVLELLTLPASPVARRAALSLAATLVRTPGVGGEAWQAALDGVAKRMREAAGPDDIRTVGREITALQNTVREWLQPDRFRVADGMPSAIVAATCGRVAQWLAGRLATGGDDVVLRAAIGAAREARRLAETETSARLTPAALRRLLEAATQAGSPHPRVAPEAGHVPCARPDAILAPVSTVVWWDFTAASDVSPPPLPWSAAERAALAREGIECPDSIAERLQRTRRQLRPVLAATTRLVLVTPQRRRGEAANRHPLWDRIAWAFRNQTGTIELRACDLLNESLPSIAVRRRPLPRPKRWWQLEPTVLLPSRERESYTSLNAFLNHPFSWVLQYRARIRPGFTARLADDNLLLGSLAHRLIADVTSDPSLADAEPEALHAAIEGRLDGLLVTEGAVLRLPGRDADRRKLLDRCARAAHLLQETLRLGGWSIIGFEHALDGSFAGGPLEGRLDVALERDDGRRAVIDMKWGSRKYRLADLTKNTALQLALYAHLFARDGEPWPATAFLVLDPPSLLSLDRDAFPNALHVDGAGSAADLWAAVAPTWRWRRAQLDRGLVEVTAAGTDRDGDSSPPPDCRLTEDECHFNEHASLTGFSPTEHP